MGFRLPEVADVDDEVNIRARLRVGALLLLGSNAVFVVADLLLDRPPDVRLWIVRVLQVLVILAAFAGARLVRGRAALIGIGLAATVMILMTMAAAWTLRAEPRGMLLTASVTVLGAAALIPWGPWAQAVCAIAAGIAIAMQALASGGAAAMPESFAVLAVVMGLGVSVFFARELEHQRRLISGRQRQRDEALAELAESESRFRNAFDNAPIGMALVGPDGRWLKVNRRLCEIVGYEEEELLAKDFQSVTYPEDLDIDLALVRETLAGKRDRYQMNKRYVHKSGDVVWVLLAVSLVRRADGRPHYFVSQIEDVTARVEAERALEVARDRAVRASSAKSEFLATMSHELRTPLGAIIGMSDILKEGDLSAEQREFVDTIHRSAIALLEILNHVLDLAKIEAGMMQLDEADLDLRAVVQESADLFSAETRRKGLALVIDVGADVPAQLRGDPGRLRQVFVNLLGNAVKFTPAGEIAVEVRAEPARAGVVVVSCSVRDTGIGISEEHQERIFDAFAQADSATSRHFGGSGLGLAICRHMVERMGGTIALHSRIGEGTCVTFKVALETASRVDDGVLGEPTASAEERDARSLGAASEPRLLDVVNGDSQ